MLYGYKFWYVGSAYVHYWVREITSAAISKRCTIFRWRNVMLIYWLVSATRPISSGIGLLVAGVLKEESLLVYQVFIRLIWEIYDIPFGPEGSLSKGHSFQG